MIDINFLKENNLIIYEVVSGSKAYGLNTKDSDTDIKGIYVLPENDFYGFEYIDQVSDESNDIVYYEIKKFITLLSKSNPTMLEMINTPKQSIIYQSQLFPNLEMKKIFSKECYNTFARYAYSQVKKARGLNKKIVNPMDKRRKSIIDFCTAVTDGKTKKLIDWANNKDIKLESCGLTSMNHCTNLYALFWEGNDNKHNFRGIAKKNESTQVITSSIPRGLIPLVYISFNLDGFKKYCKDYNDYWKWVENRNDKRFTQTMDHGKKYDAKNMMHTFRLLFIAEEIVNDEVINVYRPDRDYLLSIKSGKYEYDELLNKAEDKIKQLEEKYSKSTLPSSPDINYLQELLISIRKSFYSMTTKNNYNVGI